MPLANLRRAATIAIVAPTLLVGVPTVANAQATARPGHSSAVHDDRGDGILSNLVTVNIGRDSDSRGDRDDDGILSNLIDIDLGSSRDDSDRRDNRNDRDGDGLLSDLLGDGLLGSDDEDGLLGLGLL